MGAPSRAPPLRVAAYAEQLPRDAPLHITVPISITRDSVAYATLDRHPFQRTTRGGVAGVGSGPEGGGGSASVTPCVREQGGVSVAGPKRWAPDVHRRAPPLCVCCAVLVFFPLLLFTLQIDCFRRRVLSPLLTALL